MPPAQWLCTGRLVRVAPLKSANGLTGVGVQFDFYEVSRPERPQWAMGAGLRGPVAECSAEKGPRIRDSRSRSQSPKHLPKHLPNTVKELTE